MNQANVLTLSNVSYKYEGASKQSLKGINTAFDMGKVYAIVGKSGAGKSTLLSLIAGLDVCTQGTINYKQNDLKALDRDVYRSKDIGVIFQNYNLLINATAIENIVLSMNISGSPEKNKEAFALKLLDRVGLSQDAAKRKVLKLSGGEQQRVGIARALAHNPDIILADEPIGNLDNTTGDEVLKIFTSLAHKDGKCVIIVTHSKKVAGLADAVLNMSNGEIAGK